MAEFTRILGCLPLLLLAMCAGSTLAQEAAAPVVAVLSLKDVKVAVLAPDSSSTTSNSGAYPTQLLLNPEVPPKHQLEVSVTALKDGSEFKPQQLFLMLTSKASGLVAYAVGKARKDSHIITIGAAQLEKQIGRQSGEFDVTLLVGDPSVPSAIRYPLGAVDFVLATGPSSGAATIKTALQQPINNLKPEIVHQHRPPSKRPPASVSLVFTGLAVVPLIAVLGAMPLIVRPNFKAWPSNPTTALFALAFHGSLGGILGLYLLFWLRLNLAETLPLALGWGAVIAFTGYKLLSGLATARLREAVGKTKKE